MSVDRAVVAELEGIVGAEHVRTERGDVEPYSRDATPVFRGVPDAVVWPRTTEEVAALLRLATERRIPVVPRGAGSNLCAATVPIGGGIVLVLTRMNEILEISPDELLARVETGVTTSALGEAAATKGLLYAPDPGSRTVSTVGGNVATCAGGLRGLKYGVTRNYVLGTDRRAADRRGDPHRRAAVEGRGRLRPDPAADRLGRHARGPHRGHDGAAAHAGQHQHRGGLLPVAGRGGPGRRRRDR